MLKERLVDSVVSVLVRAYASIEQQLAQFALFLNYVDIVGSFDGLIVCPELGI